MACSYYLMPNGSTGAEYARLPRIAAKYWETGEQAERATDRQFAICNER